MKKFISLRLAASWVHVEGIDFLFNDLAGATRDSSFKPFIYFIIIPYKKHFSVFSDRWDADAFS